jgi:hypothetical protein
MEWNFCSQTSPSNCLSALNGPPPVSSNWWNLQIHKAVRNFLCVLGKTVRVTEWFSIARCLDDGTGGIKHLQGIVNNVQGILRGHVRTHRTVQCRRLSQQHHWNFDISDAQQLPLDTYCIRTHSLSSWPILWSVKLVSASSDRYTAI